jgi:hypothetical protein
MSRGLNFFVSSFNSIQKSICLETRKKSEGMESAFEAVLGTHCCSWLSQFLVPSTLVLMFEYNRPKGYVFKDAHKIEDQSKN